MLDIAAYFALFLSVGAIFVFANLLVGFLFRPRNPSVEKTDVYECGEPSIGSSYVQFDLRFYVVGLLFIIFEVEVAFFFPWAIVAGKANLLRDSSVPIVAADDAGEWRLTPEASGLLREIGLRDRSIAATTPGEAERVEKQIRDGATSLAWIAAADIGLFFAVLAVGFAYVWKRGDLDWVRARSRQIAGEGFRGRPIVEPRDSAAPEPIGGRTRRFSESL